MTQSNPEMTLAAVAQRLDRVDAALVRLVNHNRSRNVLLTILSIVTICFLFWYLNMAYNRYGGEVTPDLLASNAQAVFQAQLPSAKQQLETNLKTNAPQYVGKALDQVAAMPGAYADQINQQAGAAMDQAMPQISTALYKSLKESLDDAQKNKTGSDEQRMQATLAAIGQVYADETLKFVDQAHNSYTANAGDFTTYLTRLAQNKALDHREQLHRDMFRNLLLLMREKAKDSGNPDSLKLNLAAPQAGG